MVCYKSVYDDQGNTIFPEKLTHEFLDNAKRTMGAYAFANQYLGQIIPKDQQAIRPEWIRYYQMIPQTVFRYAFVDPAISQSVDADYTGVVVIAVDSGGQRYVEYAQRFKISPSEIIDKIFQLQDVFNPLAIGIEDVAFQKALIYMLSDEMRRRNKIINVVGIKPPTDKTKEMKISGSLIPKFEWGHILLKQGLTDLEHELLTFPRGKHDDLIDALASLDSIVAIPTDPRGKNVRPSPNSDRYERWFLDQIKAGKAKEDIERPSWD